MTEIITHPYTQALAWALVHFIWQGAAIGLASFVLLRFVRTPAARYSLGVGTMAMLLAAPAVTFAFLARQQGDAVGTAATASSAAAVGRALGEPGRLEAVGSGGPLGSTGSTGSTGPLRPGVLFAVLSAWLVGVAVLSLRLAGGWMLAHRLTRRQTRPAGAEIQALARRVAGRLALDRIVSVFESTAVSVPVMVGWIKPAVLFPVAALSGLSTTQIEALLAHELAHVQRHDYLVNLLQSVVETLLFYHPAVWWVSRQVRKEREHCCDDLAVGVCDRLVYATALADLASMTVTPRFALAATDGSLTRRVRRILGAGGSGDNREPMSGWLPLLFVALLVVALIPITAARDVAAQRVDRSEVRGAADRPVEIVPETVVEVSPSRGDSGERIVEVAPEIPVDGQSREVRAEIAAAETELQITEALQRDLAAQLTQLESQFLALRKAIEDAKRDGGSESRQADLQKLVAAIEASVRDTARRLGATEDLKAAILARTEVRRREEMAALAQVVGELRAREVAAEEIQRVVELQKMAVERKVKAVEASSREQEVVRAQARERLDQARQELERARQLAEKGLVAQRDVQAAESNLQAAERNLRAAERNLDQHLVEVEFRKQEKLEKALSQVKDAVEKRKDSSAKYDETRMKYERMKVLYDQGLITKEVLADAELVYMKLTSQMESPKLALATRLSPEASALHNRVLRDGASMADPAVISALKDAAKLKDDVDRAEVLIAVARVHAFTPEMVSLYLAAADSIRSESDRNRVLAQPVRLKQKGRL